MIDAAVAVNESVGDPLRNHLRTQTPGLGRPEAIIVQEVTDRGVVHVHGFVPGVSVGEFGREALWGF